MIVTCARYIYPVSYTHLDVYKRQVERFVDIKSHINPERRDGINQELRDVINPEK